MKNKLFIFFIFIIGLSLYPQDGEPSVPDNTAPLAVQAVEDETNLSGNEGENTKELDPDKLPEEEKSLFERTLALDIDTADYYQLIDWCQDLGLEESGDVNQLRARLKEHFKVQEDKEAGEKKDTSSKKIVIKSADQLEYFTMSGVDEKYILLEGRVILEIDESDEGKKKGNTYIIKANRLILNQELKTLTAENDIEFTRISNSDSQKEPEVLKGESFSYNLDTSVGIFYYSRGSSKQEIEKEHEETFVYYGDRISRLENDVVILDQGRISSEISIDDPNWQIKASKIWVLTPDEWAVQDAVLYLGRIPLLYLPFFFYPGDEMFFNPVFGYRNREGEFLNTTTYLMGEKKKSGNSFSVFRISQDSQEGYQKVIDGLFLKKVKSATPSPEYPKDWVFKVMVDFYSRLGAFSGVKLDLDKFHLTGGLGVSRSLFPMGSSYTPFYTENNETRTYWNYSIIGDLPLPFRFGLETDFYSNIGPLTLNGKLAYFSDPYFPSDFYKRQENKEITEYFSSDTELNTDAEVLAAENQNNTDTDTLDSNIRSNLSWQLLSSLNLGSLITLPAFIKTLNLTNLNIELNWISKNDEIVSNTYLANANPARTFFAPTNLSFPKAFMTFGGTLFNYTFGQNKEKAADNSGDPISFGGKGLIPPENGQAPVVQNDKDASETTSISPPKFILPELKSDQSTVKQGVFNSELSLTYTGSSKLDINHPFKNTEELEREDVSFDIEYSRLDTSIPLDLSLSIQLLKFTGLDYIISFGNNLKLDNQYVTRFNKSPNYSEADWNAGVQADSYLNSIRISDNINLTLKPLLFFTPWKSSKLVYLLNVGLYDNSFLRIAADNYVHQEKFFQWEEEYVTKHSLSTNLDYILAPFSIKWTQDYIIPPRKIEIDQGLSSALTWGPSTTTLGIGYIDSSEPYDFDFLNVQPLTISEKLIFSPFIDLTTSLDYDFNKSEWTESKSTIKFLATEKDGYIFTQELTADLKTPEITLWDSTVKYMGLSLVLNFKKSFGSVFDFNDEKWLLDTTSPETLRLQKITLKYRWTPKSFYFWKNRISFEPTIDTNWNINFQQFTDNQFNFKLGLKFSIHKFLDFEFFSESYNNYTYLYFPGLAEQVNQASLDNVLMDLLRSFNFLDIKDREESNFKNKSFNFTITHYLDDWTFGLSYTAKYEPVDRINVFSPAFTFSIKWSHIPQLKNIVDVKGADDVYNYNLWDQSEEKADAVKKMPKITGSESS
ncbi:MAG: LPS-assembly protein LptD [Spirochaetales bacterium]|nr:LPS-assembly protein LptD [Spirochaetales bacterium]